MIMNYAVAIKNCAVVFFPVLIKRVSAGADPGGSDWGDLPPKTYESNFIHHYFIIRKTAFAIVGHFFVQCFATAVL